MYRVHRLDTARARLAVIQVVTFSLLATLGGRLWYLQVRTGADYRIAAADNDLRTVSTPPVRGAILDDQGRPLVENRTTLEVTVDLSTLQAQPDGGAAVLGRLGGLLGQPENELVQKIRLCSAAVDQPCWDGSPYQPVPVATDVPADVGLEVLENRAEFPGVGARPAAVRTYPAPFGANAAQILGYLSPVTPAELAEPGNDLQPTDMVGRGGLEEQYDSVLRGRPGTDEVEVDDLGQVLRTVSRRPAVPGDDIVTTIDAHVQAIAEQALAQAVKAAHGVWDPNTGSYGQASSGAVVVLDVDTGGVVAMASYPSYDPAVWTGGISASAYAALLREQPSPLLDRAFQGEYPPGSTFKAVTTSAMLGDGFDAYGTYDCSPDFRIGDQDFHNFEGEAYGPISLKRAIEQSCDTVFYRVAYQMWLADGGARPVAHPADPVQTMALDFGLGRPTGIDLPGEAPGLIETRQELLDSWEANKSDWCAQGRSGYPSVARTDPARAAYLKTIAADDCQDGWEFLPGDSVLEAIGQGGVEVTPLQLARVYATIANGGTLYQPHLLQAVLAPDGRVLSTYRPKAVAHVPISAAARAFMINAFEGVSAAGTASGVYGDWPLDRIPVGSKTGTADVYGQNPTSVFASFLPADHPRYAVVMMIPQGGQGAEVSGPAVAKIEQAMFGVVDGKVLPGAALLPAPPANLPVISPDGLLPSTFTYPGQWPPAPPPAQRSAPPAALAVMRSSGEDEER